MSTTLQRQPPPRKPEDDPWRYGERHLRHVRPDGQVFYERVPLRKEDLLFPQEGDRQWQTADHTRDYRHLFAVLGRHSAKHRGRRLFGDHRIDFEVPDIEPLGPDLIVLDGVGEWDGSRGTFPVVAMGAKPLLVIEITSPDTRPNDLNVKPDLYYRCGVPCYAVVDRQSGDGNQVRVLAYRAAPRHFVEEPPDKRGRVWLEPVSLWLGVASGRAVCYDKRGRRVPAPEEQAAAEVRARKKAEREKADLQKRVEQLEEQMRRHERSGG